MLRNSFICKEINVNTNNTTIIRKSEWRNIWVSLITKAHPKDKPLLDRRTVLMKANSLGSDRYKPSRDHTEEHDAWNEDQKNVIKNILSERMST